MKFQELTKNQKINLILNLIFLILALVVIIIFSLYYYINNFSDLCTDDKVSESKKDFFCNNRTSDKFNPDNIKINLSELNISNK